MTVLGHIAWKHDYTLLVRQLDDIGFDVGDYRISLYRAILVAITAVAVLVLVTTVAWGAMFERKAWGVALELARLALIVAGAVWLYGVGSAPAGAVVAVGALAAVSAMWLWMVRPGRVELVAGGA